MKYHENRSKGSGDMEQNKYTSLNFSKVCGITLPEHVSGSASNLSWNSSMYCKLSRIVSEWRNTSCFILAKHWSWYIRGIVAFTRQVSPFQN